MNASKREKKFDKHENKTCCIQLQAVVILNHNNKGYKRRFETIALDIDSSKLIFEILWSNSIQYIFLQYIASNRDKTTICSNFQQTNVEH